jgi:histidinol-phosphate aminotransferase
MTPANFSNHLSQTLFRPEVLAMSAYHVPNAQGYIKLDAMENPHTWPESLKQAWLERLSECAVNRYPDPQASALVTKLKKINHLGDEFGLLLGNGSDEIIQMLLMALSPNASVVSTIPSFVMYKQLSDCLGLSYYGVSLQEDNFDLDLPAMLDAIAKYNPAIIFLAYPNNPSGNLFNRDAVNAIIAAANGLVIIDEAYEPFANASFMPDITENVLVMRTFSKWGLAGLRLGYIAGHRSIIEQLHKIRLPYNINVLTQASVLFALEHQTLFDQQAQAICAERAFLFSELQAQDAIIPYASAANFILFRTPLSHGVRIFESLKRQGILIKNLHAQGGVLADCLRVTVGKHSENIAFMTALQCALSEK